MVDPRFTVLSVDKNSQDEFAIKIFAAIFGIFRITK